MPFRHQNPTFIKATTKQKVGNSQNSEWVLSIFRLAGIDDCSLWMALFGFGYRLVLHHIFTVMMTLKSKTGEFVFCHPHIASILSCPCPKEKKTNIFLNNDQANNWLFEFPTVASTDNLIVLAHECDNYVFGSNNNQLGEINNGMLQALADLGGQTDKEGNVLGASVVAATLLALNGLESAIRHSTGHVRGRAPLLKTMISKLEDPHLSKPCELLLLPQGVNLRNLLWHGFIEHLPRPWLSLVLVLTKLLLLQHQDSVGGSENVKGEVMNLRTFPVFQPLIANQNLDNFQSSVQATKISQWLPDSHRELWGIAVHWIQERRRPASICAVLSVLLEHGLRLDWCRLNDQQKDVIPRPGAYFVTLDGHGQHHIHDLLLYPYLNADDGNDSGDQARENKLLYEKNGSTIAFLTDLFCSSCGGPNIRATVAHGLWDSFLLREWTGSAMVKEDDECQGRLWDMVRLVLVAMDWTASSNLAPPMTPLSYQPTFSYAAVTQRSFNQARASLQELQSIQESKRYQIFWKISLREFGDISDELRSLDVTGGGIPNAALFLLPSLKSKTTLLVWTAQDVFEEHDLNTRLANTGATRTLLEDILAATNAHIWHLQDALTSLEDDGTINMRKRKTLLRSVHSSQLAKILYSFATQVAIVSLQQLDNHNHTSKLLDQALLLKAVERSRMVVSTVDTFLVSKVDRAHKSAKEYTKGKAIKTILQLISSTSTAAVAGITDITRGEP